MFLYIIGNGFDKAHNLPTDYRNDLMRILKQKDNEKFQFINNLYFKGDEKLWSHFEDNIGNIKKYDELDQKYTNIVQDFLMNIAIYINIQLRVKITVMMIWK